MRSYKNLVVLSVASVVLVIVIVVAITINPIVGAALGPLLLGVAKIITAIAGHVKENNDSAKPAMKRSKKAKKNRKFAA